MNNIFISYRREDSEGFARGLFQSLVSAFGTDHVFMDVEDISLGADFALAIDKSLESCGALLVLIGPEWVSCTDAEGRLRLDNAQDFVRMEVVKALDKNVRVIPVLVKGAKMPAPESLPEVLQPVTRRQALELRHERWNQDVNHLASALAGLLGLERLDRRVATPPPPAMPAKKSGSRLVMGLAAVAVLAVLAVGGYGLFSGKAPSRMDGQPEIQKQAAQDPDASSKPISVSPSEKNAVAAAPKPEPPPPPKVKPTPKQPQAINLAGLWVDADGINVQIAQQGNEVVSQAYNPLTGLAVNAVWQINGRRVAFNWASNMGNQGVGEGTISSDGNTIDYRYVDHYTGEQGYSRLFRVVQ